MISLTINAGSSSVRLHIFEITEKQTTEIFSSTTAKLEKEEVFESLSSFLATANVRQLDSVVHRFVHGGNALREPTRITKSARASIEAVSELAPLHNPQSLAWLAAAESLPKPATKHIAVFDTGLYQSLPEVARTYPIPHALTKAHSLYRYGFHGIAHSSLYRQARACLSKTRSEKVITLQLGSGCSATAFIDGKPIDTSMGFSPLEGLMMATRSGDLDPGLLLYMQSKLNFTPMDLERILNKESGLLGVSGKSADMRELLAKDDEQSNLAVDLYCHKIRKTVGAFIAELGGVDAVIFGGGVGENSPAIREKVLRNFCWCGLELDPARNEEAVQKKKCISTADSSTAVWVLPVDEANEMVLQAKQLLLAN